MKKIIYIISALLLLLTAGLTLGADKEVSSLRAQQSIAYTTNTGDVELIGQIGGRTNAMTADNNYAYIGVGPRLIILDISNPSNPTTIGQTDVLPGIVQDVVVVDNYAYVAASGLRVINVADPSSPTEIGALDTGITRMTVVGSYAYVVGSGLRIINIANPTTPIEVGSLSISAKDIAVEGNYAYVTVTDSFNNSGLRIIDIADPTSPIAIGALDTPGWAESVAVAGNYVYVADGYDGLRIIDVTNTESPSEAATFGTMTALGVEIANSYAYIADDIWGLRIVDISDPTAPSGVGVVDGSAQSIIIVDSYAYVLAGSRLRIINVANPANATEIGFFNVPSFPVQEVVIANNYAYIAGEYDGLSIVDVTNPVIPTEIGFLNGFGDAEGIAIGNNYAYVAVKYSGLHIINITDPSSPSEVGVLSLGEAKEVVVVDNYAYVVAPNSGLHIINITDPANPTEVGSFNTLETANDVAVAGSYAYVVDRGSLYIIDVTNPEAPSEISALNISGTAIAVAGGYAYVADSSELRILDITNPEAPSELGSFDTTASALSVEVVGNYVYVGTSSGLTVINVVNPTIPRKSGFFPIPSYAKAVTIVDNYAYVAADEAGLLILHFMAPEWYIETVEQTGDVGRQTSIDLDSNGTPHISYFDVTTHDLKYARVTDNTWQIQQVDNPGETSILAWEQPTSLALDDSDRPHISYFMVTAQGGNGLKYAYSTSDSWEIQALDAQSRGSSLALDSNAAPHISSEWDTIDIGGDYYGNVDYSRWTGDDWAVQGVESGYFAIDSTSLALDETDIPHLSYSTHRRNEEDYRLKYAYWTGSSWAIQTVESLEDRVRSHSLYLDSNGNPHISYDIANGVLKYAYWTGSDWNIQVIDNIGDESGDISLRLDGNDNPHISYYDAINHDLKYAHWTDDSWSIEFVDSAGDVGRYTSLVLDSNGTPHISYYDVTNGDLKYAVRQPPATTPTPTPTSTPTYTPSPITTSLPSPTPSPTTTPDVPTTDSWTFMLYLAGDTFYIDSGNVHTALGRAIGRLEQNPNAQVNVVALLDGPQTIDTFRVTFNPDAQYDPLGEKRMDDPATLIEFVEQAQEDFPADHYYLAITDHANGVQGIAWDTTSNPDRTALLTPSEIRQALMTVTNNGAQPLDVIHYDGCSFGLLEDAAIGHELVHYTVASENTGWGVFAYSDYRDAVGSSTTGADLALAVAQRYAERVGEQQYPYTISALDMSQLDSVITALNSFSEQLTTFASANQSNRTLLHNIRNQSQLFDSTEPYLIIDEEDRYVDLVDFTARVQQQVTSVETEAEQLIEAITGSQPFVLYEEHRSGSFDYHDQTYTWNLDGSYGVSIYYPPRAAGANYGDYISGVTFPNFHALTNWHEYLQVGLPPLGPGDPLPEDGPDPLVPLPFDEEHQLYLPVITR